jgi:hypothetical protein
MSASDGQAIDRRALAAALVTVVVWASAFVGIRDLVGVFSPGTIALGRLSVGPCRVADGLATRGPA